MIRARGTLEAGKDSFISTTNLVDGKAGNITLQVGTLNLRDQAEIIAKSDSGAGGNLTIQATNSVNLFRGSTISTASLFGNAGGDLLIETGDLQIIGNAVVDTGSFGGRSGNITIRAKNSVALREAANLTSFSFVGRGGDIDIETKNFALLGGSQLFTATFGEQPAGSVNVRALDTIEIAGITNGLIPQSSGIFTRASGQGNAGNITLKTNQLSMRDRGQVSASSLLGSSGRGGNIDIQANSVEVIGTVDIFNRTAIDTRADGTGVAGTLSISSNILSIQNGAQISASTLGYAPGGTISITSDLIEIIGQPANSGASEITAQTAGFGNQPGGNIQLSTSILAVRNGGQVNANTLGRGDAGNIVISAQDLVLLSGTDGRSVTGVFSNVAKKAQGNGGNIQISTNSLEVLNGAQLFATTLGSGNAGNVLIQAQDAVLIKKTDAVGRSSGLFTSTSSDGQGGNITVNTRTFQLSDGAVVDARTAVSGNSGNVAINAATVDVLNGGQLLAITEGSGRAGSITVNASDLLTISGTDSIYATRLAQFDTQVSPISASSGIFVRSQGTGGAGDVTVNAPQIRMDRGIVSAESAAVDGGNINLNVGQLLLLRNSSLISATAGTAEAGGNGGNITINAPKGFIVGVKGENSDITANAFTGSGGRVNITAQGIYGLQFRPKLTEFSDITASSTFGVSGVVAINTLGIDPSRGLQQLPVSLIDPSNRIDQKCAAGSGFRRSSFTVTGRGGLPESPLDPLQSGEGVASWVEVKAEGTGQRAQGDRAGGEARGRRGEGKDPIIEATGWVVDKNGSVFLVAKDSVVGDQGAWQDLPTCLPDQ